MSAQQLDGGLDDIFGFGKFVRPVADAVAAGKEDHGDGGEAGHEERVVVGAADHFFARDALLLADVFEKVDHVGGGLRGSVGVDQLFYDSDLAPLA